MTNPTPKLTYLKDYTPSHFLIDAATLQVDLHETATTVKTTLTVRRNPASTLAVDTPLVLDGENMVLKHVAVDGNALTASQYQVTQNSLTISNVPAEFTLQTEVEIKPQENTRLSGLYKTGKNFCTQCESHGFRHITYSLDRPDVLTRFTTVISAEKALYPVLLSNGNLVDQGDSADGRHWVRWEDPTLKPSYLFALVAGNLDSIADQFITQSGRPVKLFAYVEHGKREQGTYAMECLKQSMRWDEEKYGREYDLDIFMIVGVSDFNFGAMENKGLNIFNDKYILAHPSTATDTDFININNVIAHEYFHNWSGNRVTVRDWFQITLKEGLTVFRDQQYISDKTSPVTIRIQEVRNIRNLQFVQDAGPMAHPIYPDSYIEINNFYTVTVYEKGCEVIRMIHTLLGEKKFRQSMDLYFSRHDGHPATTHDFVQAMQDSSGVDLQQFWRWYKQAGTPVLDVTSDYNAQEKTYTLTVKQSCPPTADGSPKEPFHIPFSVGLLDAQGNDLPLQLASETAPFAGNTRVLDVKQPVEVFKFVGVNAAPTPSLLRNFSAPVKLHYNYSQQKYLFLMAHDSDLFNRWNAAQQLATDILLANVAAVQKQQDMNVPDSFLQALAALLQNDTLDKSFVAEMLTLPAESYLLEQLAVADVDAVHTAREWLRHRIAQHLQQQLLQFYQQHAAPVAYNLDGASVGVRRLKSVALAYLTLIKEANVPQLAFAQFQQANNMTDSLGAMSALVNIDCPERERALNEFYQRWQKELLVVHKWFTLQAQSSLPNTLAAVEKLTQHPAFDIKNPNCVRSLLSVFCSGNLVQFHDKSGAGYQLVADFALKIDSFNPQLASRIVEPLIHWRKFDATRQALLQAQLRRILATKPLSNDVYEVVSRSLENVSHPQHATVS